MKPMEKQPPLTPSQIRAGRALLDWSQDQLAEAAGTSLSTVRDYEKERRGDIETVGTLSMIRLALQKKGVIFFFSEGGLRPTVRLVAKVPDGPLWPATLGR